MVDLGTTVRLFISSTFSDFQREREALQRHVFPRLRQLCAQEGCRFQPIDLRWGVTAAAGEERQTLRICFDELERCQTRSPDFCLLILLGDRYGAGFLPERVAAPLLLRLRPYLTAADAQAFEPANAKAAYVLDQNADPHEYVLGPRGAIREADEASLRRSLAQAATAAGCSEDEVLPFIGSATHLEVYHGLLASTRQANGVFAAFRTVAPAPSGGEADRFQEGDAERRDLLARLKHAVEKKLAAEQVLRYKGSWNTNGPEKGTPDDVHFASQFLDFLEPRLRNVLAARRAARPEPDAVAFATAAWVAERREHVVGRTDELEQLMEYIAGTDPLPFVLTGAPGSGKSTLMAELAARVGTLNPQAALVTRYVGVSSGSSSLLDLLMSLHREINERFDRHARAPQADVGQLATAVAEDLRTLHTTAARPLVLLVDALDQLGAERHATTWLPHELAPHVRVVVSAPLDQAELADLQRWIPPDHVLTLGPLKEEDARDALLHWVASTSPAGVHARRTLTEEQVQHILAAFAKEGRPLYLRLVADEAKRWRSFDAPPVLPSTLRELLASLLTRLERPELHGRLLVRHALGDLAAARNGLAEDELLDVLARDDAVRRDLQDLNPGAPPVDPALPLPVVLWARLAADVAPLLSEREADAASLLTFYHRQFDTVVADRYLHDDDGLARHKDLASYFGKQLLLLDDDAKDATASINRRQLSELPYQQAQDPRGSEWRMTLTDARFLEQKIAYQGTGALLEDMQLRRNDPIVTPLARVISAGAVVLNRKPDEVVNQVTMRWWDGASPLHNTQPAKAPAVRLVFPSRAFNPDQIRIFQGLAGGVNGCVFSPDGRLALSASGGTGDHANALRLWDVTTGQLLRSFEDDDRYEEMACAFSPDGSVLLGSSDDGILRLWDAATGELLQELREHRGYRVRRCTFSPDGKLVLSASDDMTLRLWDVITGQCLRVFEGHGSWVNGCAFSPDGQTIVSAAGDFTHDNMGNFTHNDNTVRVWDAKTGEPLKVLRGHTEPVIACAFSPNGKQVVSAALDATLRLWNVASAQCLRVFQGHQTNVTACDFSPDGRNIVSGSLDRTLKLWEAGTGRCVGTLRGHTDIVNSCAFSPDGQTVLSASGDKTLRLWDVRPQITTARTPARSFEGHSDQVQCCAFSLDGRFLITGARDATLWLWDTATGRRIRAFTGHLDYASGVKGCDFSPNGSRVVSAAGDKTLHVWDTATGARLCILTGHEDGVNACSFSPDGNRIVSASRDGTVRVWDAATGDCLLVLENLGVSIPSCKFSPDGQLIASVSHGELRLWDAETGRSLRTLAIIPETGIDWNIPRACAFSADGRTIIIAVDKTVQLVGFRRGADIFRGHTDDVASCAFSPDGQSILSASHDRTVRLWSVSTGEELAQWLNDAWVRCCAFSPDGVHAAAGDDKGSVHFFELAGLTISTSNATRRP